MPTGPLAPNLAFPPESDSSGEAVFSPQSVPGFLNQGKLYHYGVVPELTIGSPKAVNPEFQQGTPRDLDQYDDPGNVQPATPQALSVASYQLNVNQQAHASPAAPTTIANETQATDQGALLPTRWVTVIEPPVTPAANPARSQPPLPIPLPVNTPAPVNIIEKLSPSRFNVTQVTLPPGAASFPSQNETTVPSHQVTSPPAQVGGAVIEEEEVRPAFITVISIFLLIMACLYGLGGTLGAGLAYVLNLAATGTYSAALTGLFLKSFPQYIILPLMAGLSGVGFLYAGLRVRQGSRKAWITALLIVIICPIMLLFLGRWVMSPINQFLDNPQLTNTVEGLSRLNNPLMQSILSGQLGILLIGLMLLLSGKLFRFPDRRLGKKATVSVIIFALLTVVPIGGYLGNIAFMNLDTDLGFNATAESAGFHIYRPITLPESWIQVSLFSINRDPSALLVGRDTFAQIVFDKGLKERVSGQPSRPVTVRQIDVPPAFDVQAFAQSVIEGAVVKPIAVQRAQGQQAYYIEKQAAGGTIRALALVTSDNVLILLSTKEASEDELTAIANTLD